MFERFTVQARQIVVAAQEEARRLGDQHIGTEHLLLGLIGRPATSSAGLLSGHGLDAATAGRILAGMVRDVADGMDAEALETIGIDLGAVRERVEATFGPGALDQRSGPADRRRSRRGHLPFTRHAKQSFGFALRAAQRLHHGYIGDGHLLLGLLEVGDSSATRILVAAGVDPRHLRAEVEQQLPPDIAASTG